MEARFSLSTWPYEREDETATAFIIDHEIGRDSRETHAQMCKAIEWCDEQFGSEQEKWSYVPGSWVIRFPDLSAATAFRLRWC